ncbi:MAG: response regulator [Nocardioidaceae bacterium]
MRVLLIEDESKMTTLLERGLREEGLLADVAANGEDGVWAAQENDYDAVVLDVMLPDISGFDVCRRIRAASVWTPILMLTARSAVGDRVTGLDAGADDYLGQTVCVRRAVGSATGIAAPRTGHHPPCSPSAICGSTRTHDASGEVSTR